MILFINACPREGSRTKRLALALLDTLGEYREIELSEEKLPPLDGVRLARRTRYIEARDYSDEMFRWAKEFAAADEIVIAAPFWDLTFPALLKIYLENIYVTGLVSEYDESGRPCGLCRAKKLWYVTTAGGALDTRFGFEYVRSLAQFCFGIEETELVKAELLDIAGNDAEAILRDAIEIIKRRETR